MLTCFFPHILFIGHWICKRKFQCRQTPSGIKPHLGHQELQNAESEAAGHGFVTGRKLPTAANQDLRSNRSNDSKSCGQHLPRTSSQISKGYQRGYFRCFNMKRTMTLSTWIKNKSKDWRKTDFIKSFSGADAASLAEAVEAEELQLAQRVSLFETFGKRLVWTRKPKPRVRPKLASSGTTRTPWSSHKYWRKDRSKWVSHVLAEQFPVGNRATLVFL